MKPANRQTDSQLKFNIADCEQAISANPSNPKVHQYLNEMADCQNELMARESKRIARRTIKEYCNDYLTAGSIRSKNCARESYANFSDYAHRQVWTSQFDLGYKRLHGK